MSELAAHIGDWLADGQEQRRERVTELMRTASTQLGLVEDSVERLPHVRFVESGARHRGKDPVWQGLPDGEPRAPLPTPPPAQDHLQLMGQIDAAALMVLWRRELAANDVACDQKVSASPVDVTSLQPRSSPDRMPVRSPVSIQG